MRRRQGKSGRVGARKSMKLGTAGIDGVRVIDLETKEICKGSNCTFLLAIECMPMDLQRCTPDAAGNVGSGNQGSMNIGG